ncbi:hypothetical protein BKA69DRAFT_1083493 [Paraphysoderma sedebokerense]|nr:hypothetical protein BKA69DRAFT_1083493 [Paraphysoderma sedebokerense]
MTDSLQDVQSQTQTKPKRKKTLRACNHCQKAHITCDNSRPCQKCIKRGLADTCTDGIRKRAKYLQDIPPDLINPPQMYMGQPQQQQQQLSNMQSRPPTPPVTSPAFIPPQHLLAFPGNRESTTGMNLNPNLNVNANYGFGSEAVNLEYSILSNMLGLPTISDANQSQGQNENQSQNAPMMSPQMANVQQVQHPQYLMAYHQQNGHSQMHPQTMTINPSMHNASGAASTEMLTLLNPTSPTAMTPLSPIALSPISVNAASGANGNGIGLGLLGNGKKIETPSDAYASVTRPYNYTEGFHYLISYVKARMEKSDILRICRALAQFRPSFIALILNLTEEDLIFMEKCFQRTILEFDKLISLSGTPTVVWRRTGEIALVGKEFSLLTGWGKDILMGTGGKRTYIYELMDTPSAVSYWENFASLSFSNSSSSSMSIVTLLCPNGKKMKCSFCFTVKKDIFDVPLAVVGNFLPILS